MTVKTIAVLQDPSLREKLFKVYELIAIAEKVSALKTKKEVGRFLAEMSNNKDTDDTYRIISWVGFMNWYLSGRAAEYLSSAEKERYLADIRYLKSDEARKEVAEAIAL